jgi:hypothetical protein
MAKTATYSLIASYTVPSATANYTFSSISGAYTDLIIVVTGNSTAAADLWMQVNGDTGSNYSTTQLSGTGSSALSQRSSNRSNFNVNFNAYMSTTVAANYIIQFQDYSNATTYKTMLARSSNANQGVDATVGLWRNTAAITSVTLIANGSTFATGTTFKLYGIQAGSN